MKASLPEIVSEPAAVVFWKVSFEQPQAVLQVAEELLLLLLDRGLDPAGRSRCSSGYGRLITSATTGTIWWRNGSRRPIW